MRKPDSEHRARTLKKVPTMNWLTSLANGLKSLLQKKRVERELDEELDSYLEASAAYKQSVGIAPEAARRAALIEVGSRNAVKHQVWSSRWESGLHPVRQVQHVRNMLLVPDPRGLESRIGDSYRRMTVDESSPTIKPMFTGPKTE